MLPTILLPPTVFLGLSLTLWTFKCLMMIIFQNKIIYMPNIPPFSRSEAVEAYTACCWPVRWRAESVLTGDGVRLGAAVGGLAGGSRVRGVRGERKGEMEKEEDVVVLYFQGWVWFFSLSGDSSADEPYRNASSLPPRLPFLSNVLKMADSPVRTTKNSIIVAVSYRGFWTSTGRPSQKGIERDADAALSWVFQRFFSSPSRSTRPKKLLIWGQSIGAGVATTLTARYLNKPLLWSSSQGHGEDVNKIPISGLILETPFTNMRDLLLAFYPQRWLPYRYLGPFLRSHWNNLQAMQQVAQAQTSEIQEKPKILMLQAGSDEVVPAGNAEQLERWCRELGLDVERRLVQGALHSNVVAKGEGQDAIARFLRDFDW